MPGTSTYSPTAGKGSGPGASDLVIERERRIKTGTIVKVKKGKKISLNFVK